MNMTPLEAVVLAAVQSGAHDAAAIAKSTGIPVAAIEPVAHSLAVRGLMNSMSYFGDPGRFSRTALGREALRSLANVTAS
jgi:hypothetical protein